MTKNYRFRRISPEQFTFLRNKGELKLNDFLYFTGRHTAALNDFLTSAPKGSYTPTMADVMILELCARHPDMFDRMSDIADDYYEGPRPSTGEPQATVERTR